MTSISRRSSSSRRRSDRRGRRQQQGNDQQRALVGPGDHPGDVQLAPEPADLLPDRRRRRRPLPRQQRDPAGADRGTWAQQRRPSEPVVRQPSHHLHARVRRRRFAEQLGDVGRLTRVLPEGHPHPDDPNAIELAAGKASQIYFAENLGSYVLVDAQSKEFNYQTRRSDRPVHALQGQGRRADVELRAPRRVRTALREPRPADLRADHVETRSSSWSATSAPASRSWRRS